MPVPCLCPLKNALAVILLLISASMLPTSTALLYKDAKLIDEFNSTSFNTRIYEPNRTFVYLVEFYNSWCGHCQAFAPKYEALAESVEPWRRWVHIAAIDCSVGNNFDICTQYNILQTPTLLFFHPLSNDNNNITNNSYAGDPCSECDLEVYALKETIARYLVANVEYLPALAKNLIPLNSTATDVNSKSLGRTAVEAVVFEGPKSLLGIDIVLRLVHVVRNVSVHRSLSLDMAREYGANGRRPALVIVTKSKTANNGKLPTINRQVFSYPLANYTTRLRKFIEAIGRHDADVSRAGIHSQRLALVVKRGSEPSPNITRSGGDTGGCDMTKMPEFFRPHANDINSGVIYSLRAEVLSNVDLRGKKKHALKRYLNMLLKFAPLTPVVQGAVQRLRDVLEKSGTDNVRRVQVENALRIPELNNTLLSSLPLNWTACRASKPGLRGYPCSLWITFHTITVGAYNDSLENNNASKNQSNAIDYEDGALAAVAGYVENFFSCRECVKHFMKMWRKFEHSLSSNSSVLPSGKDDAIASVTNEQALVWLWKAHNLVNARLAGDVTEDPHFPKVKFPPRSLCMECYGSGLASLDTFNDTAVVQFFQSWYSYPLPETGKVENSNNTNNSLL